MNIPYNAYMEPVKEFIALYCIKFAYGYMKSLYYEHTFGPLEVYNNIPNCITLRDIVLNRTKY